MSRRVVVTGVGLLSPLGIGTDESWKAIREARNGISRIEQFDATAFNCRIAGEVEELRSRRVHRTQRNQEDGPLHSVRHRGLGIRAGAVRSEGGCRERRARGRGHRKRHRRIRGHRARTPDTARKRSQPHIAFFHSGYHHQPGFRLRFHSNRRQGPELRYRHRLHHQRACHRRFLQDYSAGRRGRDDLRRSRGVHHSHGHRRVRGHARAFAAQR